MAMKNTSSNGNFNTTAEYDSGKEDWTSYIEMISHRNSCLLWEIK